MARFVLTQLEVVVAEMRNYNSLERLKRASCNSRHRRRREGGLSTKPASIFLPALLLVSSMTWFALTVSPSFVSSVHAAQPIPTSQYFGNAYNSTQMGSLYVTNTTQMEDVRFTARYSGDAVPRLNIAINYYVPQSEYDVVVGIQSDSLGSPSGHFLGAFVWNVSSGMCNGCGGWVSPRFAPKAYSLNHTISLVAGTVYHIVLKYFNGTFTNNGGCYSQDCLNFGYIGGTNFQQESLDMHPDPNQALLSCGNTSSCAVVPGANAVYAVDFNGSAWWQGQSENMVYDRGIGAAKGGNGLDSYQGERFWMISDTVTVSRLQVILSKVGSPTGQLNVIIWNFTAVSPSNILSASNPQIVLNQTLIPNLSGMEAVNDQSFHFSLEKNVAFQNGHLYQMSFVIYGNTTTVGASDEVGIAVTTSGRIPNALKWDGVDGSASFPCRQYVGGCAGFRYAGSSENSPIKEAPSEDIIFMMKIDSYAIIQPISVGMSNSAPSATVAVKGCYSTPAAFSSDGTTHLIEMIPSCASTLSFANAGNLRDGFSVSGNLSASIVVTPACPSGTCPGVVLTAYEQLQNSYQATPIIPTTWDANLTIPVTGTQLGSAGRIGCTISASKGHGGAGCQGWFDYDTQVTLADSIAVSGGERWLQSGGNNFTDTIPGITNRVSFIDQFQVSFKVDPDGTGSTNPSGSNLWETFGPLPMTATPGTGHVFSAWSADTKAITFTASDTLSITATIHGSGTITAAFLVPVSQPIALNLAGQRGVNANFSLSGCSVFPTSVTGDGNSHSISASPSCKVIISAPTDSPDARYRFDSGGGVPSVALSVSTCAINTCPAFSTTYYEQVNQQFAYAIVGGGAPYLGIPTLNFTALGAPATYSETSSLTTTWVDFGTQWSLTNQLAGSTGTERWVASSGTSGTATAAANQTTAYQHQYVVVIATAPPDCGLTKPSGPTWESKGATFAIASSATPGCTFSSWQATGVITIAQPDQPSTTAFSDAGGSVTAIFSKSGLPLISTNEVILLVGAAVIVAVAAGLFMRRQRRSTDTKSRPKEDAFAKA
jgi:hypothetical protein